MGKQYEHLSLEDRCWIARLHEDGQSIRQIAAAMDRPPSTISRELRRNRGTAGRLQTGAMPNEQAKARRWTRIAAASATPSCATSCSTACGAAGRPSRSPAGWPATQRRPGSATRASIASSMPRSAAPRTVRWRLYLPSAKSKRGWRGRKGGSPASFIQGRVSIAERPKAANGRAFPGHWEADLMLFKTYGQAILVAHERVSRILILAKQPNKTAEATARKLSAWLKPLPPELRQTITFDNGTEFAKHYRLKANLGIQTFFCDTHSPWQKGGIENAIGRMRAALAAQNRSPRHPSQNPLCLRRRLQQYPAKMPGLPNPGRGIPRSTVALQM